MEAAPLRPRQHDPIPEFSACPLVDHARHRFQSANYPAWNHSSEVHQPKEYHGTDTSYCRGPVRGERSIQDAASPLTTTLHDDPTVQRDAQSVPGGRPNHAT